MSSLTCYKDPQVATLETTQALDALYGLVMESEMVLSEEIRETQEVSQRALKQFKSQLAYLAAENDKLRVQLIHSNSLQKQQEEASSGEVNAWKQRAEAAEKLVQELQQKNKNLIEQSKQDQIEATRTQEQAIAIAVQTADARVNAIQQQFNNLKQQIQSLGLEKVSFQGHTFDLNSLQGMAREQGPDCSCHGMHFRNYCNSVYLHSGDDWSDAGRYYKERKIRAELANILATYLLALKKISA